MPEPAHNPVRIYMFVVLFSWIVVTYDFARLVCERSVCRACSLFGSFYVIGWGAAKPLVTG